MIFVGTMDWGTLTRSYACLSLPFITISKPTSSGNTHKGQLIDSQISH